MKNKIIPSNNSSIKESAQNLIKGRLVAFPTETVYGLGANATDGNAVGLIYSVKGRPKNHPLIVHISGIHQLGLWAIEIPDFAYSLAMRNWPGPMTLILNRSKLAKNFITGNQNTVAVRVPDHPVTKQLMKEFESLGGLGIVAPSANRFGRVSPTSAQHVEADLGEYLSSEDVILDGGKCRIGIESTIIDCLGKTPKVLRRGSVTINNLETDKYEIKNDIISSNVKHSGQFENHYSPSASVYLDVETEAGDGFLALSRYPTPKNCIRLGSPKNSSEFAQQLYAALRKGDELKLNKIIIISPDQDELGLAVRERLEKAKTK